MFCNSYKIAETINKLRGLKMNPIKAIAKATLRLTMKPPKISDNLFEPLETPNVSDNLFEPLKTPNVSDNQQIEQNDRRN